MVLFMNPLDHQPPLKNDDKTVANNRGQRWARSGMTFEEMSLHPSIDASKVNRADYTDGADGDIAYAKACRPCTIGGSQHWHGYVLHGQLQTC